MAANRLLMALIRQEARGAQMLSRSFAVCSFSYALNWAFIAVSVGRGKPRPTPVSACKMSRPQHIGFITATYSLTNVFCRGCRVDV